MKNSWIKWASQLRTYTEFHKEGTELHRGKLLGIRLCG
jgi:hypothetical protein